MKHRYFLPAFSFLILFAATVAQAQVTSSDTISIKRSFDSASRYSTQVSELEFRKDSLEKELKLKEEKLKNIDKRREEYKDEERDLRAKTQRLQTLIKSFNDSLTRQKTLRDSTINALDAAIVRLEAKRQEYIKDTMSLKKSRDSLAKDTTELTKKKEQFKVDIEKQKAVIESQKDSLEVIAEISVNDSAYVFQGKSKRRVKINEVHINVKEGVVTEIIVRTEEGVFRNKAGLIDLIHFGQRGRDRLYSDGQKFKALNKDTLMYVELADVVYYLPRNSYGDLPYADFRIHLLPDDTHRTFLIKESTSINSYFSVAAFTDIKGLTGEPNGLAQFTADAKFITNTRNVPNYSIIFLNYVAFHGNLSKFDNDFKGTPLFKQDSISRKDILQRSNFSIGIKGNLVRFLESALPRHLLEDMQINIGYNFLGAKVYDTLYKDPGLTVIDTVFRNITQNQFYIEPNVTFTRHKNFSMKLGIPFYINSVKKSAGVSNASAEYWVCPSINLMYYGKRDSKSKLFFRYNHFINIKDPTQAFSQMQLGYSVNLTDAWGGGK